MNDQDWLAERFEANRSHLRGIAYRMLGSLTEADDAVQEFMDSPEPQRHQRRRQPPGLVDDCRRAGEPQHAASAQDEA